MKATVHSTEKLVKLNGVETRIWEGHTDKGLPIVMFVALVRAEATGDNAEFVKDLREHSAPSRETSEIPMRMIL